jgi:hypothetical protein
VRERPILFSGAMVRAILDGSKTQTRRVVKYRDYAEDDSQVHATECPYGQPGDRLWVRETWSVPPGDEVEPGARLLYRADPADDAQWSPAPLFRWRPSIHMPRWASRLSLDLTGVRVEPVQDISEADAIAEGRNLLVAHPGYFPDTWDAINAARGYGWDANPWVWVLEFAPPTPRPPEDGA